MCFRTWQLPSAFRLSEEETRILEEAPFPPIRIPRLTAQRLRTLVRLLREVREKTLVGFRVKRIVRSLDSVARRLLTPGDPLREGALRDLGVHAGFSQPMARAVLDGMAPDWSGERLEALLQSEFENVGVLDGPSPNRLGGRVRALGYPLTFHLGAGTVPGVAVTSMIRGLLVKSAVLLKPGRGDVVLPRIYAQGLREEDPDLAESVAVLYWPRDAELGEVALEEADLVVVYGGDDSVGRIRLRMPPSTPLLAFRHRMGVGYVGRGTGSEEVHAEIAAAARAVSLFDQRGCVSPHVFLVERGGHIEPKEWARLLAAALEEMERDLPSGPLTPEEGAFLHQVRGAGEMEAAAGRAEIFHGGPDAPWTVIYQPEGSVEPSCLNRTVRVIPVEGYPRVAELLRPWAAYLQTVGVARLGADETEVLEGLARMGVSRITDLKDVPWPPPWWHQDGTEPLRSMVRWTDVDRGVGGEERGIEGREEGEGCVS